MTMDRTLRTHGKLLRIRSVLTRAERIAKLTEEDKFDPEENTPFGLPKVKVHHSKVGTKTKKAAEDDEGVEAEAAKAVEGAKDEKGAAEGKAAQTGPEQDKK